MDPATLYFIGAIFAGVIISFAARIFAPENQSTPPEEFQRDTLPVVTRGDPKPIVFGTCKVTNWHTLAIGPITPKDIVGDRGDRYLRYAVIGIGICKGPVIAMHRLWADDTLLCDTRRTLPTTFTVNYHDFFSEEIEGDGLVGKISVYSGSLRQSHDPILRAAVGANRVPAYREQCYIVFSGTQAPIERFPGIGFRWGTRNSLVPLSAEIEAGIDTLGARSEFFVNTRTGGRPGGLDMNNAAALWWVLTQKLPTNRFDRQSFLDAVRLFYREGHGFSHVFYAWITTFDLIGHILRPTNSWLVPDGQGRLRLLPIREHRGDPDFTLTIKEIIGIPRIVTLNAESMINQIKGTFEDRQNSYQSTEALSRDQSRIEEGGGSLQTEALTLVGCKEKRYADRQTNDLIPLRTNRPKQIYVEAADEYFTRIPRPGNTLRVVWHPIGLDITTRINEVIQEEDEEGKIGLQGIQLPETVGDDIFTSTEDTIPVRGPGPLLPLAFSRVVQIPYFLNRDRVRAVETGGGSFDQSHLWYIVERHDQDTGSTGVRVDTRILTPAELSQDSFETDVTLQFSPGGDLAEELNRGDSGMTMTLHMLEEMPRFPFNTEDNLREGHRLILVNNEWIAYRDVTVRPNGEVVLNNLERGLMNSYPARHDIGSQAWLTGTEVPFNRNYSRTHFNRRGTVDIKLIPVNPNEQLEPVPIEHVEIEEVPLLPYPPVLPLQIDTGTRRNLAVSLDPNVARITFPLKERNRLSETILFRGDPTQEQEPGCQYRAYYNIDGIPQDSGLTREEEVSQLIVEPDPENPDQLLCTLEIGRFGVITNFEMYTVRDLTYYSIYPATIDDFQIVKQ